LESSYHHCDWMITYWLSRIFLWVGQLAQLLMCSFQCSKLSLFVYCLLPVSDIKDFLEHFTSYNWRWMPLCVHKSTAHHSTVRSSDICL
jgi:hypothetical protein